MQLSVGFSGKKHGAEGFRAVAISDCSSWLLQVVYVRRTTIGGAAVGTRRHRNHDVFALLAVEVFHPQQHFVLLHAELRLLADRQQHRMLLVPRTDAINYALGL